MKLGKRRIAPANRSRLLHFADYVQESALPPIPAAYDASFGKVQSWGMDGNDTAGDCTIAAAAHLINSMTAAAGEPREIAADQCITQYSKLSGYKPGNDATDIGLDPTDVLNAWRQTGLFGDPVTTGFWWWKKTTYPNADKIAAYVSIPVSRDDLIEAAIYLFGGVYFGLELPTNWETLGVKAWAQNPTITSGEYAPNPDLGHMVMASRYDALGNLYPVTWGEQVVMARSYRNIYSDCCFAVLSADVLDPTTGKSPAGFDIGGLTEDLQMVTD